MKRIIVSLFFLIAFKIAHADVNLQLDRAKVQLGETFNLTLTMDGSETEAIPDLTGLRKDFTILGSERSMSYNIINGQARSIGEWTIMLTAKRDGNLTIPALPVGQLKTPETSIEVTQGASATDSQNADEPSDAQKDVMISAEISDNQPYVNQQILYTVKLYNSRRLLDASYQPPKVEDALMVPFGNERRYQVTQGGRNYVVEEQQFAIFPQKSGALKIQPPSFNALIYDIQPNRISVEAKATPIQVQPIPANYQGKDWLPAKQITLSDSYDKNTSSLPEGSTLVRTIRLDAVGVPAQLIPSLDFGNSDEFSIYPDKPTLSNAFKQDDLVGTSTITLSYLLNKPGKITIPALKLSWFNTTTGKEELTTLPELAIEVKAHPNAKLNNENELKQNIIKSNQPSEKLEKLESRFTPIPNTHSLSIDYKGWWLALGLACLWLLTLLVWYCQRQKQINGLPSKRQLEKQLKIACTNNHTTTVRDLLLLWARLQWPTRTLLNLNEVEQIVSDEQAKIEINNLIQALYHQTKKGQSWQGTPLWLALSKMKSPGNRKKPIKQDVLAPINRL